MTQEEKAKAYDDLLVKLQKAKVDNDVCDERYCCVIDDIVPELAESDDDMIRKALIDYFDDANKTDENPLQSYGIHTDKAIAWLEKQGEQKEHLELKAGKRSATTIIAVNGANSTAITDGNTSVTSKKVEKQYCTGQYEPDVREFPIEWKQENVDDLSEFERAMMHIGGSFFGEKAGLDPNNTNDVKEQAKFLLELAPKQEWSEEDEKYLQELIEWIDCFIDDEDCGDMTYDEHKEFYTTRIDWLKSLKDKVQSLSQPKEWSEEDERMLNDILMCGEHHCYLDAGNIDWLKSLKERYTWKPTKQQLTELRCAISGCSFETSILVELEENLKKLL